MKRKTNKKNTEIKKVIDKAKSKKMKKFLESKDDIDDMSDATFITEFLPQYNY